MRSLLLCCLAFLLAACTTKQAQKPATDWSVKLQNDTKPYGLLLANQSLQYYFPAARAEVLSKQFRFTSIDEQMRAHPDSPALMIMVGIDFFVSKDEWQSLVRFVQAGNELMIFSARLDEGIQKSLHLLRVGYGEEMPLSFFSDGKENMQALSLLPDTTQHFGYTGHYIGGYFSTGINTDSSTEKSSASANAPSNDDEAEPLTIYGLDSIPEILGRSISGPDFIRYHIGRGHITLHAAPLALSNYFLLQANNRAYLDGIWHTLPNNISVIYSGNFEKRKSSSTPFSVLFKYPAIRAAMWILFCTLILYVLFSIKKLQRRIAIINPLPNESVSFVETIGRLYYNKGRHENLAAKMIQHFLDWVRTSYYLNTSQLDETFAERLAAKSGKPVDEVAGLLQMIHDIRLGAAVDANYLQRIYTIIQSYYKA